MGSRGILSWGNIHLKGLLWPLYIRSLELELLNSEATIEADDFAEQHQTALAVVETLNVNMIS